MPTIPFPLTELRMSDDTKKTESIAEKLKRVTDPNGAMGSSKGVQRTGETEAPKPSSLTGINEGVHDDDGKLIGRVGKNVDNTYQPYTDAGPIDKTYPTRKEAEEAVKRAHAAKK